MTDTSTEAVQALIARNRSVADDAYLAATYLANEHVGDLLGSNAGTLQALLDERDALTNANARVTAKWSQDIARAERAEAERDEFKRLFLDGVQRAHAAEAELARLTAKLDAVKAIHRPVEVEPSETICAGCSTLRGHGDNARYFPFVEWPCETATALADTPEPKDSVTFDTDDLGPVTDIDGNIIEPKGDDRG